jgi:hypothetical protein
MVHEAAGTDGWGVALFAVYGLTLWVLAVAGILVLAAQVGRARGRGRPTRRPWV